MDFTFNEDELTFREAINRFLVTEAAPENLRAMWENDEGRSQALLDAIAEQGLTALSVPEDQGGLAMSDVAWSLMNQELGYFAIPDALTNSAYIGAGLLSALDNSVAEKNDYLTRISEGKLKLAIGLDCCELVADANSAEILILQHGDEVHIVPRDQISEVANPSLDPSRHLSQIKWQASPQTCVASGEAGAKIWQQTINRGALCVAGQLLGLAQRMLDMSVEYAKQRKQFGKLIGSFQAVKHHLADVAEKIEFAKPVLYRAAYSLENNLALSDIHVSQARMFCAEAAKLAARHGIQVHGAMGYTWEVDLQMYMKRSWAITNSWGDNTFHQKRVMDYVLNSDVDFAPSLTFVEETI